MYVHGTYFIHSSRGSEKTPSARTNRGFETRRASAVERATSNAPAARVRHFNRTEAPAPNFSGDGVVVMLSEEAEAILDRAAAMTYEDGPLPETFHYDLHTPSLAPMPDPRPAGAPEPTRLDGAVAEINRLQAQEALAKADVGVREALAHLFSDRPNYTYRSGPGGQRHVTGGNPDLQFTPALSPEGTLQRARIFRALAVTAGDVPDADGPELLQTQHFADAAAAALEARRAALMSARTLEFATTGAAYTGASTSTVDPPLPSNALPLKDLSDQAAPPRLDAVTARTQPLPLEMPPKAPLVEPPVFEPRSEVGFSMRGELAPTTYRDAAYVGYFPVGGNVDVFV